MIFKILFYDFPLIMQDSNLNTTLVETQQPVLLDNQKKITVSPVLFKVLSIFAVVMTLLAIVLAVVLFINTRNNNTNPTDNLSEGTPLPTPTVFNISPTQATAVTDTIAPNITTAKIVTTAPTKAPNKLPTNTKAPVPSLTQVPLSTIIPIPTDLPMGTYFVQDNGDNESMLLVTDSGNAMPVFFTIFTQNGIATTYETQWFCTTNGVCNAQINLGGMYGISKHIQSATYVIQSTYFKLCNTNGSEGVCKK
jgi:hypothetical protein